MATAPAFVGSDRRRSEDGFRFVEGNGIATGYGNGRIIKPLGGRPSENAELASRRARAEGRPKLVGPRMTTPRASIWPLASAAVGAELGSASGPADASSLPDRVRRRLRDGFASLVGPAGFEAVLNRSLVLARRTTPLFARVTIAPDGSLQGLEESDRTSTERQAIVLLAQFVELASVLIGEDLAVGVMRKIWPALPGGGDWESPEFAE